MSLRELKNVRAQSAQTLGQTLLLSPVVIGTTALGAAVLWAATSWLWLVVHEGRIERR
jgi:hypothetical protein